MKSGQVRKWVAVAGLALVNMPLQTQTLLAFDTTHAKAAVALSAAEHEVVAAEYRQHAEVLNALAAAHEQHVYELMRQMAQRHRWPGLSSNQLQVEKSKAVEARRAAREAMGLADHHMRLAVEAHVPTGPA